MDRLLTVVCNLALFGFAVVGMDCMAEAWLDRRAERRHARRERDAMLDRMTEQAFARARARHLHVVNFDDDPFL